MMTFLAPAGHVLGGVGALGEEAGGFDHDLGADLAPGQRRRGPSRQKTAMFLPSTIRPFSSKLTSFFSVPCDGVILEQVGQRLGVGQIVDADDFDVTLLQRRAEEPGGRCGRSR